MLKFQVKKIISKYSLPFFFSLAIACSNNSQKFGDLGVGRIMKIGNRDHLEEISRDTSCEFSLSGPVAQASVKRVIAQIEAVREKSELKRAAGVLCLNSSGGDIAAAIKFIQYLSNHTNPADRITTFVKDDEECLSACALIFMMGYSCNVHYCHVHRVLSPRGMLGFHSPFLRPEFDVGADNETIALAYDAAIKDFGAFILEASKFPTANDTDRLPLFLLEKILTTGKSDYFLVDSIAKLIALRIDLAGPINVDSHKMSIFNKCENELSYHTKNPRLVIDPYFHAGLWTADEAEFYDEARVIEENEQLAEANLEDNIYNNWPIFTSFPRDAETSQEALFLRFRIGGWALNTLYSCTFIYEDSEVEGLDRMYVDVSGNLHGNRIKRFEVPLDYVVAHKNVPGKRNGDRYLEISEEDAWVWVVDRLDGFLPDWTYLPANIKLEDL